MAVENTLTAIYSGNTSKLARNDIDENSDVKLYEADTTVKEKITNELDKTAIIEKSNDFPETNFKTDYDEPFQPDEHFFLEPVKNKTVSRKHEILKKEKRRRKKIKQFKRTFAHIFGSILLVIFIISLSSFLSYYIVSSALDFTGIAMREFEVEVEIPKNATTEEISEILYKSGIINIPDFFVFYSRVAGADGKYLNGLFSLSSSMSYSTIISSLQSVERIDKIVTVRIREGMTAAEIGLLLEENFVCKASDFEYYYKNKQNKYNFEKRVLLNSNKFYQLEGYLFPDTYEFYAVDELIEGKDIDTSSYAEVAADKIYSNCNSKITKEMYKKINEMGFTLDEFMTLASMVQSEAGTLEDMHLVASVFLNRLKDSGHYPKLQSDVTILYVENFIKPFINSRNEGLFASVIKAYNTYEADGLPPGPICNPGLDAMGAVLNAPDTNYYYFCANEETLEMFYAEDIQGHEKNLILAGLA